VSEPINLTNHNWLNYVRKKCVNYAERENEMDCKFTHSWRFHRVRDGKKGRDEGINRERKSKHKTGRRRGEIEK